MCMNASNQHEPSPTGTLRSRLGFVWGFAGFGLVLGFISAGLVFGGPILILLAALGLWLLMLIMIALLGYRNRTKAQLRRHHAYQAALGVGCGFAASFLGILDASAWLVLIAIVLSIGVVGYRLLHMGHYWSQLSPPMRRFMKTILLVNVPTVGFLLSYLFIVVPLINNPWAIPLAFILYLIPNSIAVTKAFMEFRSSLYAPKDPPKE